MKILRYFVIIGIILLSISTVNAGWNPQGTTEYMLYGEGDTSFQPVSMIYDFENSRIIYADNVNAEIREFTIKFPLSSSSTSLMVQNVTGITAITLTPDGNIVYGNDNNDVYKIEDFNGIIDKGDEADNDYFTLIHQIDSDVRDIVIDANGNYFISGVNDKIWKVSMPYFAVSQLSGFPSVHSGNDGYHLEMWNEGLIIGYLPSTLYETSQFYYVANQTQGDIIHASEIATGIGFSRPTTIYLNDGNTIMSYIYTVSSTRYSYIKHINTTTDTATPILSYTTTTDYNHFTDIAVDEDGLIFAGLDGGGMVLIITDDIIESAPFAASEIYAGSGGTSLSSVFQYVNKDVSSTYNTYYNNSDLLIDYNIKTDYLQYSSTEDDLSDQFMNNYEFRVDLLNPSGINEQSFNIYPSQMVRTTHVLTESFFGIPIPSGKAHQYSTTGTNTFKNSNNWINGTWEIKLYEVNSNTSTHTLLDTETFAILNEQSDNSITINNEPDNIDGTVLAERLVSSPYFYALVIIVIIGMACGAVAGGVGFLGGATLGVFISGGMALIPMWLILSLIIAFIVLFAIIGGKSIGGGN